MKGPVELHMQYYSEMQVTQAILFVTLVDAWTMTKKIAAARIFGNFSAVVFNCVQSKQQVMYGSFCTKCCCSEVDVTTPQAEETVTGVMDLHAFLLNKHKLEHVLLNQPN